jgi:hypothetical protein
MKRYLALGCFVLAIALSNVTHAGTVWQTIASGCVPGAGSNNIEAIGQIVRFKPGTIGDIELHCPVTLNTPQIVRYFQSHYGGDGDGTSTEYYVYVEFRRFGVPLDSWATICSRYSSVTSNVRGTCNFGDFTLDIDEWNYYFYVHLHRNGTSWNPTLYGISLHD